MMLDDIIKKAKGDEEEREPLSLKIPSSLKSKLDSISKKNKVSLNSLMITMIETMFEDNIDSKNDYRALVEAENSLSSMLAQNPNSGIDYKGFLIEDGIIDNFPDMVESTVSQVLALRKLVNGDK